MSENFLNISQIACHSQVIVLFYLLRGAVVFGVGLVYSVIDY